MSYSQEHPAHSFLDLIGTAIEERFGESHPGANGGGFYQNYVFSMHAYCWCEQVDCPWCRACGCPWDVDLLVGDRCVNCRPGAPAPAPNFIHYGTGTKVWWYKYLGRSTRVESTLTFGEWDELYRECVDSISA